MPGRLKGQFFMAGALMLCVLFFLGMPMAMVSSTSNTMDMTRLSENMEGELSRAVNLAMLEDGNPARMGEFIEFVRNRTTERYLDMEILAVAAVPDPGSPGDVDVHAGNWLGRPVTISVEVDGNSLDIDLDDEEIAVRSFSGVPGEFVLEVSFEGRTWSGTLPRDKTNLYSYLRLSRGGNLIVKEMAS